MDQLVVTVNDSRLLPVLEKAIGLLRGVSRVQVVRKERDTSNRAREAVSDIPSAVKDLIGVASGFSKKEIEEDARLSYLLNK